MPSAIAHPIGLTAHAATPGDSVEALEVRVSVDAGVLTLRYSLRADMSRVRVSAEAAGGLRSIDGRTDGLWKHTCFEAFVAPGSRGAPGELREYFELNFSAAKQWAAYRFDAYREGMAVAELMAPPEISVRHLTHGLELDATVQLPAEFATTVPRARLALSAVVEEESGRLSYWAARHAPGRPDFHHPEGFAFEL